MNRKNLTAAVCAGLAGAAGLAATAQAVNLNPDGLGQVLIYPYYTSNDGNQTILSVVNTTENAKAVKVRFLEGFNSREVLDFNLYLSRHDVWVAAIVNRANSPAGDVGNSTHLVIPDDSCTVPYLYEDNAVGLPDGSSVGVQTFLDRAYTGSASDNGPTSEERMNEGHFEIIRVGGGMPIKPFAGLFIMSEQCKAHTDLPMLGFLVRIQLEKNLPVLHRGFHIAELELIATTHLIDIGIGRHIRHRLTEIVHRTLVVPDEIK